jgi:RNA recognition motif. (a.k.a. RRM, RBD, or RNP domain)
LLVSSKYNFILVYVSSELIAISLVRISPATAKFKPPPVGQVEHPHVQFPSISNGMEQQSQPITIALPLSSSNQTKSVSAPIAATSSATPGNTNGVQASGSGSSIGGSSSTPSLSSGSSNSVSSSVLLPNPDEMLNLPHSVLAQIAQQYANGTINPPKLNTTPVSSTQGHDSNGLPRYMVSEESWKHHAQARAILGNLIGPNGEQLTSTDPYNTTVFVGGLSPLISEETLRTFFAPFGDIHYVRLHVFFFFSLEDANDVVSWK